MPWSWRINAQKSCALLLELSGSTFVETTVVNQRFIKTAPVQSAGHNISRRAQGVDKGCSNKTCCVPGWATIKKLPMDTAKLRMGLCRECWFCKSVVATNHSVTTSGKVFTSEASCPTDAVSESEGPHAQLTAVARKWWSDGIYLI